MDYDLNRLGEREFEHLTQALAIKVLGPGVEAFGDGADGGREATFEGKLNFPHPDPGGPWEGYGVIQAKFRYRPRDPGNNATWLKDQLKGEFEKWLDPDSGRGRRPEYFLAVSNVVLSPYPESGGIDSVNALIKEYAPQLGLKGYRVWHYDQLCRLLDVASEVAHRYFGLITPGDVLARLHNYVRGLDDGVQDSLSSHVAKELLAEQWVRLGQAGDNDDQRLRLDRVAIDLPAILDREEAEIRTAAYVIARGNKVLRPSLCGQDDPGSQEDTSPPDRLVLLGGPGQGKTTLAQLICQVYRVALLTDLPDRSLPPEVRSFCEEFTGEFLGSAGLELPVSLRWPFHIRLDQYADRFAADPNMTILRYIARKVTQRAPATVTEQQLLDWLSQWPWLLVLDGLDEVADQQLREDVLRHIRDFQIDAARRDADLLTVATTRPQGYGDEFDPDQYEYLRLRPLEEDQAVKYAERLAGARHASDPDKQERVLDRIRKAAREQRTSRLMRSPLQISIMSLLLERRPTAPQHRYDLFKGYYDTLFAREVAKATASARLLEHQKTHVDALQEAVGLVLQVRSEQRGDAEAALSHKELRQLAMRILRQEEYGADQADILSGKLVSLAMQRLVLLTPMPADGIGFEVRSLQEFMAARALVSASDTEVIANLVTLVPSAHWRNTWLLAAGRIFSERAHLRGDVLSQMRSADVSDALSRAVTPAAHLAADLLEEQIAETSPRYQALLVQHAIELLRKTPGLHLVRLADVLAGVMSQNATASEVVEAAISDALASAGTATLSALIVCATWASGTGTLAGKAKSWLRQGVTNLRDAGRERRQAVAGLPVNFRLSPLREYEPQVEDSEPLALSAVLGPLLSEKDLDQRESELARKAVEALAGAGIWCQDTDKGRVTKVDHRHLPDLSLLDEPLEDQQVIRALIGVMDTLGLEQWPITSLLRRVLGLWLERRPIGQRISVPVISDHG
ncbi:NACHT domain-containing protein [Streptomyces sp. NPDC004008]